MAKQTVFQEQEELDRLAVQHRLLAPLEERLFRRITGGATGLRLLELGCNDGSRMAQRFSGANVARAVGLEYCAPLAQQARERYGGAAWSFHSFDLDIPDPLSRLRELMDRDGVDAFDLIDAAFVLSHLRHPEPLLRALRELLAPGGRLVIIEGDDAGSTLTPDPEGLLPFFLALLAQDPFAGDRGFIRTLPDLLGRCGYRRIASVGTAVTAAGDQPERKEDMFHVYFSFLPQDVELLEQAAEPSAQALCAGWTPERFAALREAILAPASEISIGVGAVICSGGE